MSSSPSTAVVGDTISQDTQPSNQVSAETQLPEHKKPTRPATILHKKTSARRLVGRLPITPTEGSPYQSGAENISRTSLALAGEQYGEGQAAEENGAQQAKADQSADQQQNALNRQHHRLSTAAVAVTGFLGQLKVWAHSERQRQKTRRDKKAAKGAERRAVTASSLGSEADTNEFGGHISPVSSGDEAAQAAMDAFEALVAAAEISYSDERSRRPSAHRRSSRRRPTRPRSLKGGHTSDTDYASDGEPIVPSCDEVLQTAEEVGMDEFKSQALKLAHTLRCKGWRGVALDRYREISVERISGALTNAVFMVSPPSELPSVSDTSDPQSSTPLSAPAKIPAKLLLRIYGPQVYHLIDRDTELSILRRLARKRIGPRLWGTFLNGRFEEFFPSRTLTREDIRVPETSRHIAKRLRELHEGIELEEGERQRGPIVWRNWEKWVPRARSVMAIVEANQKRGAGPVVGCSWDKFQDAVEKYKDWLYARYGGVEGTNKTLVFAHNDTQYGNILRLEAAGKSPLLLPMNEHRQLIVIDFEYASANTPGFEFANHFCEWMSNYHDPITPYAVRESQFPNLDQQRNFLRAYVEHRLAGTYGTKTSTNTPDHSTLTSFNLDARKPALSYREEETDRQRVVEETVETLLEETRVWRAASHAVWCVWGIVQAKVSVNDVSKGKLFKKDLNDASAAAGDTKDKKEDEDEFDYLSYAQQRALLFWGDMLELGLVEHQAVDEFVLKNAKKVE